MNDDFLYQFRRDPSPRFAAQLRASLGRAATTSVAGIRSMRVFALGLLSGVAVMASAWFFLDRDRVGVERPTAQAAAAPPSPAAMRDSDEAPSPQWDENGSASSNSTTARDDIRTGDIKASKRRLRVVADATTELFPAKVAEELRRFAWLEAPLTDRADTSAALQRLCSSDSDVPDIAVVARRIQADELQSCRRKGRSVTEGLLGHQAVVLTAGKQTAPIGLTAVHLYLALAREIPGREVGQMSPNPHRLWISINPLFDARPIQLSGPAAESLQGQAMLHLLMERGCDGTPWVKELKSTDYERYRRICHSIRDDGVYDNAPHDGALVTRLWAEPDRIAIADYTFYSTHRHVLKSSLMDGEEPAPSSIGTAEYPGARAVYVYAIGRWSPEQNEFLKELFSEYALGPAGYFVRNGLLALDERQRAAVRNDVIHFEPLESLQ